MPRQLGLEWLTVLGMRPADHAGLAADLGCSAISTGLTPLLLNPHGYPAWSLRDDADLRREFKAVLADRGIAISVGEGLNVSADADVRERAGDLDMLADLGARAISAADMGVERGQALDQLALLAEMSQARGMDFLVEFCPAFTLRKLDDALEAVRFIGEGQARVLIDAMHFFRSGGTVPQIAALDASLIGHVQLCDAERKGKGDYLQETITGRLVPGQGDLPLRQFVDALPRGCMLGLKVPMLEAAKADRPAQDYVAEIVTATRSLLA
jgi:Sugar phosphate isomerases/epimerases